MGMNRQRGFTLLEVLIAGFILFLVISSMTFVYRGALLSSNKAESAIKFTAAIPSIKQQVIIQIREGIKGEDQSGLGEYGKFSYIWTGTTTHRGTYQFPDAPGERIFYYLMLVELEVTDSAVIRNYSFSELVW